MSEQPLAETVQAARQGDLNAFNHLVLEYQDEVYNLAYRVLGEAGAAQEATRAVFQEAYRQLNGFRKGPFRLWLLRIAARVCLGQLKGWSAPYRTPPSVRTSPVENSLQACLRLIPPELRLALVLIDLQGLSYPEAAAVLDASPDKLLNRLAQARQWVMKSGAPDLAAA